MQMFNHEYGREKISSHATQLTILIANVSLHGFPSHKYNMNYIVLGYTEFSGAQEHYIASLSAV